MPSVISPTGLATCRNIGSGTVMIGMSFAEADIGVLSLLVRVSEWRCRVIPHLADDTGKPIGHHRMD
ncbi:MAG: hypothetical protein VW707_04465, partial [Candidatus Puniceispirillum sp.]